MCFTSIAASNLVVTMLTISIVIEKKRMCFISMPDVISMYSHIFHTLQINSLSCFRWFPRIFHANIGSYLCLGWFFPFVHHRIIVRAYVVMWAVVIVLHSRGGAVFCARSSTRVLNDHLTDVCVNVFVEQGGNSAHVPLTGGLKYVSGRSNNRVNNLSFHT